MDYAGLQRMVVSLADISSQNGVHVGLISEGDIIKDADQCLDGCPVSIERGMRWKR